MAEMTRAIVEVELTEKQVRRLQELRSEDASQWPADTWPLTQIAWQVAQQMPEPGPLMEEPAEMNSVVMTDMGVAVKRDTDEVCWLVLDLDDVGRNEGYWYSWGALLKHNPRPMEVKE